MINSHHSTRRIVSSAGISFSGSIISAAVAFISSAYVSRHLSVSDYGVLQLVTTYYLFIQALENVAHINVVKIEMIKAPELVGKYISATAFINLISFSLVMLVLGVSFQLTKAEMFFYLLIVSTAQIFKVTNGLGFYLDAQLKVVATQGSLVSGNVISSAYRIVAASMSSSLVLQLFANPILLMVNSLGLLLSSTGYFDKRGLLRFDSKIVTGVVKKSFPLFLTALVTIFMFKLDILMLGFFGKHSEIGYYSNAVKLTEPWSYVALALVNAMFPTLIGSKGLSLRKHYRQLRILFCALIFLALGIAAFTSIFANEIVLLTFGANYIRSIGLLKISIWSNVFLFLIYAQQVWEVNESLQRFTLMRFCAAAALNFILNLALIPHYGAEGCAIASVVTYGFATIVFNLFSRKTRFLNKQIFMSLAEAHSLWKVIWKIR